MSTINVSLPLRLRKYVQQQVRRGGYGTTSEFFRELLRDHRNGHAHPQLERLLLEGIDSGPARPMRTKDWDDIRERVLKHSGRRKK